MRAKLDRLVLSLLADGVGVLDLVSNLKLTRMIMDRRDGSRASEPGVTRDGDWKQRVEPARAGKGEERGEKWAARARRWGTLRSAHCSSACGVCETRRRGLR